MVDLSGGVFFRLMAGFSDGWMDGWMNDGLLALGHRPPLSPSPSTILSATSDYCYNIATKHHD